MECSGRVLIDRPQRLKCFGAWRWPHATRATTTWSAIRAVRPLATSPNELAVRSLSGTLFEARIKARGLCSMFHWAPEVRRQKRAWK